MAKLPGECSEQQDRFARYVVKYGKYATAYRLVYGEESKAKPESMWQMASHMMNNPDVQARVEHYRSIARKKWEVDIGKIVEQLAKMAFVDKRDIYDERGAILPPDQWPEHIAKSVAGIEVFEERDPEGVLIGHTKKVKFESRTGALQILAKYKGMLVDRVEVGAPGEFDNLSDDELDKRLRAREETLKAIETARKPAPKPVAKKRTQEES
jgi:phage terminase small subunit